MYFWKIPPIQLGIYTQNVCRLSKLLPFALKPKGHLKPLFRRPFSTSLNKFPPPSPQTSSEPVNSPCFNNFLEANHVRYLPTPLISAPYLRTRTAVFSAGQGSRCPKNFLRALSGGGVRFGKLFGMAEAG